MSDRFRGALTDAWKRIEERQWIYGKPGKLNADASTTYAVPGRAKFIYVTIRNAAGAQTVVPARNDALVPLDNSIVVKIRLEKGVYVIYGVSGRPEQGGTLPDSPFDNLVESVNGEVGAVVLDADNIGETASRIWFTTTEETKLAGIEALADVTDIANVGAAINSGAADTPLAADKVTFWDVVDGILKTITWTNLLAVIHSATHTLTNKTLDSTNAVSMTGLALIASGDDFLVSVASDSNRIKAASRAVVVATMANELATTFAGLGVFRGARAFNSANISIPNATFTALTFDSEDYDSGSAYHHPTVNTGRLTVPFGMGGIYIIIGQIAFTGGAGVRGVQIRLNGTTIIASNFVNPVTGASTDLMVTTEYNLAVGDYVELLVYQDSGAAINVLRGANYSPIFSMSLRTTS
jgi:hypothetical protein